MGESQVVYKFDVPYDGEFSIKLPRGAQVLCVDVQNDEPKLWVQMTTETAYFDERYFKLVPTGMPFNADYLIYIGTFLSLNTRFVGHLYEMRQIADD